MEAVIEFVHSSRLPDGSEPEVHQLALHSAACAIEGISRYVYVYVYVYLDQCLFAVTCNCRYVKRATCERVCVYQRIFYCACINEQVCARTEQPVRARGMSGPGLMP